MEKKHCSSCSDDRADGYIQNSKYVRKDGSVWIGYKCRKCNRERTKKYYHANKEKVRAIIYKSIKKHWIKQVARIELNKAIARKDIKRPRTCSRCATKGRIQGHHENYTKPLEVVWLCTGCHAEADKSLV